MFSRRQFAVGSVGSLFIPGLVPRLFANGENPISAKIRHPDYKEMLRRGQLFGLPFKFDTESRLLFLAMLHNGLKGKRCSIVVRNTHDLAHIKGIIIGNNLVPQVHYRKVADGFTKNTDVRAIVHLKDYSSWLHVYVSEVVPEYSILFSPIK